MGIAADFGSILYIIDQLCYVIFDFATILAGDCGSASGMFRKGSFGHQIPRTFPYAIDSWHKALYGIPTRPAVVRWLVDFGMTSKPSRLNCGTMKKDSDNNT